MACGKGLLFFTGNTLRRDNPNHTPGGQGDVWRASAEAEDLHSQVVTAQKERHPKSRLKGQIMNTCKREPLILL